MIFTIQALAGLAQSVVLVILVYKCYKLNKIVDELQLDSQKTNIMKLVEEASTNYYPTPPIRTKKAKVTVNKRRSRTDEEKLRASEEKKKWWIEKKRREALHLPESETILRSLLKYEPNISDRQP